MVLWQINHRAFDTLFRLQESHLLSSFFPLSNKLCVDFVDDSSDSSLTEDGEVYCNRKSAG